MLRSIAVGAFLLCLVLAVSVPLSLITGAAVWRVQKAQRQQQEATLLQRAHEAATLLDRGFGRLANRLSVRAGSTALAHGNLEDFAQEMRLRPTGRCPSKPGVF
jgi:hypothetical protein